ncbi:MAG: chorismate mutase, partial [Lentisphaerota bacterium]
DELRKEIDRLDDSVLELIDRRYELVKKVGVIKQTSSLGVFVPEREKAIIDRLSKKAGENLPIEAIVSIYREIISGARLIEHPITVVHLKGDLLSIQAAYAKFGSCIKLKPLINISDLLSEIKNNLNTYAVIPHADCLDPELKILSEISIKNPHTPSKNLKFFIVGR